MKQKTMVLIVLAVICGLGASFMTSKLLADRQKEEDTTPVLVAKKNLDTGLLINKPEELFEVKDVPKETAPKNALTKLDDAKKRIMKLPRRTGDTLTQDDLIDKDLGTMQGLLPPGHRAIGIRVSPENIANGFAATPHSRVDISCSVRGNTEKDTGTRFILQDVLVLASGKETMPDQTGKAMLCDVVTVALTPEDGLKLDTARSKGNLNLMLRPFGEKGSNKTGLMTWANVTSGKSISEKDTEEVERAANGPPSEKDLFVAPTNQTPVSLKREEPKARPFVQTIRNGDRVERYQWKQNEDGEWESELLQPAASSTSARVSSSPPANTAAAAPKK